MGGSLGTSLRMWDGELPLSDRFRLIRCDHRGHGGSPAPPGPYDIADLAADVLERRRAISPSRAISRRPRGSSARHMARPRFDRISGAWR